MVMVVAKVTVKMVMKVVNLMVKLVVSVLSRDGGNHDIYRSKKKKGWG